jgi:hypothetical protein
MSKDIKFENGDLYDIGQTVNGISRFVFLNEKWNYFEQSLFSEYQYGHDNLSKLIIDDELMGFDDVKYLGNIFNDLKLW